MRYEYTLTEGDRGAFLYFHANEGAGAPAVRAAFMRPARAARRVCLASAGLLWVFALLLIVRPEEGRGAIGHPAFPGALGAAFAWAGWWAASGGRMRARLRRVARAAGAMPLADRRLGPAAASVEGEELVVEQQGATDRFGRGAAGRVDESAAHFFVTLGDSNGLAIPKRGKSEVEVGEMRAALRAWSGMEVGVVKTEMPEFG